MEKCQPGLSLVFVESRSIATMLHFVKRGQASSLTGKKKTPAKVPGFIQSFRLFLDRHHPVIDVTHTKHESGGMVNLRSETCDNISSHTDIFMDTLHELDQTNQQGVNLFKQALKVLCAVFAK